MAKQFGFLHNAVRQLIPLLGEAFSSANKALTFLRAEGMGIGRSSFLAYWGEIHNNKLKAARIKYVRADRKPSDRLIGYSRHEFDKKFQVIAEVSYTDVYTGREATRKISYLTNSIKTKGEMVDTLWGIAILHKADYDFRKVNDVQVTEILSHNKKYDIQQRFK